MSIFMFLFVFFWFVLLAVSTLAFMYGGYPERAGTGIIIIGSVATAFLGLGSIIHVQQFELGVLFTDSIVLLALVLLTLRSVRYWPLWATSFHAITVMTHVAALLSPQSVPRAYLVLQGFWIYPMFIAILLGIYGHRQSIRSAHNY